MHPINYTKHNILWVPPQLERHPGVPPIRVITGYAELSREPWETTPSWTGTREIDFTLQPTLNRSTPSLL